MTTDTVGGVWNYTLELVEALAEHDIEVILATMGEPMSKAQTQQAHLLSNLEIQESNFKLEWMHDPWREVSRAGEWLLGLEANLKPDIIHLNGYAHAALPWNEPVLVVGHSCVLSWWKAVRHEDPLLEWQYYRQAVARGLHAADMVVAPSQTMLDALHEHYGPLPQSKVIYNGRIPGRFRSGIKQEFIIAAGRLWDEAKNISALSKVAPDLCWPVYVAGEARDPDGHTENHSQVKHLGHLSSHEMTAWLANASIYALPTRYEPFGLSILEAALSGCALVLGDIPSLREIWEDSALFIPPDNHDALKAGLTELIANQAMRTELASRAHSHALKFNSQRMADEYVSVYGRLIQEHQPATEEHTICAS